MAVLKKAPGNLGLNLWCPGCGHGIFVRLVQEVLEEKGLAENNVCMLGVGCSANANFTLKGQNRVECHHGRAPSTANGMKRMLPDTCIWTYQGDGDAYAIGLGETILAAQDDLPITVFVINNNNYGMTGGQAGMTTLEGQKTATSTAGKQGKPIDVLPMICTIGHVGYVARGTTASLAEIVKLKKYIAKAIDMQMVEKKYSIVEILSQCPTNWHMTLPQATDWVLNEVTKHYPLGEFKK